MAQGQECNSAYQKLIAEITKQVGEEPVTNQIKQNYENVIESRRTLNSIKTLGHLINVLELRDEINLSDVSVLKNLLEYFGSSETSSDTLKSSYQLVVNYIKLNKPEDPDGICTVCSAPTTVKQLSIEPVLNYATPTAPVEDTSLDDVHNAINEISSEISGWGFTRLGRHLDVKESVISNLKTQVNVKDMSEIVHEMLEIWVQEKGDKATVEALISALEHKHVARRDLALKLKTLFKIK